MGGYLSVAYCEKYPHRVERLVLLSPVGVPEFDKEAADKRMAQINWKFKALLGTMRSFWKMGSTPMSVLRMMPEGRGKWLVDGYVKNRLKRLMDDEKEALASYFYSVGVLPGSGEYCLQDILLPGAMAKNALVDRIPKLSPNIPINFLYGAVDWMDFRGGVTVQEKVESDKSCTLKVDVRIVEDAGHLLNLENPDAMNESVANAINNRDDARIVLPHTVNKEARTWTKPVTSNRV